MLLWSLACQWRGLRSIDCNSIVKTNFSSRSRWLMTRSCFFIDCRCRDMFENGSYLRRRKRFKLTLPTEQNRSNLEDDDHNKSPLNRENKPSRKPSFLIDHLLAHDTTNDASYMTSSPSSSSETNSCVPQLPYTTDFDLIRQLTLFNEAKGHQLAQLYW